MWVTRTCDTGRIRKDFQSEGSELQKILISPTLADLLLAVCATNIRKHHTWQLAAYRFYKRWSWLFRKAAACTPALRGDSRSVASLGLITQLFLSKCNCSRFASLKFPFTLILVGTIIALWQWLCNNQWEVLMGTHPLLCNTRHRAMIMPVNLLHTRLTHISPSY